MKSVLHYSSAAVLAALLGLAVAVPAHAQDPTTTPSPAMSDQDKRAGQPVNMSTCEKMSEADKEACMKKVEQSHPKTEKQQETKKGYDPCPGGQHKGPAGAADPCAGSHKNMKQ